MPSLGRVLDAAGVVLSLMNSPCPPPGTALHLRSSPAPPCMLMPRDEEPPSLLDFVPPYDPSLIALGTLNSDWRRDIARLQRDRDREWLAEVEAATGIAGDFVADVGCALRLADFLLQEDGSLQEELTDWQVGRNKEAVLLPGCSRNPGRQQNALITRSQFASDPQVYGELPPTETLESMTRLLWLTRLAKPGAALVVPNLFHDEEMLAHDLRTFVDTYGALMFPEEQLTAAHKRPLLQLKLKGRSEQDWHAAAADGLRGDGDEVEDRPSDMDTRLVFLSRRRPQGSSSFPSHSTSVKSSSSSVDGTALAKSSRDHSHGAQQPAPSGAPVAALDVATPPRTRCEGAVAVSAIAVYWGCALECVHKEAPTSCITDLCPAVVIAYEAPGLKYCKDHYPDPYGPGSSTSTTTGLTTTSTGSGGRQDTTSQNDRGPKGPGMTTITFTTDHGDEQGEEADRTVDRRRGEEEETQFSYWPMDEDALTDGW